MAKQEYRSSVRSRRLIREAFAALLMEKELDRITVTDIVSRADINRSTFYAHYPDVRGLVDEKLREIVEETLDIYEKEMFSLLEDPFPLLLRLSRCMEANYEICRYQERRTGTDEVLNLLRQLLEEMFVQKLGALLATGKTEIDRKISRCLAFYVGGVFSVYMQWFHSSEKEPLENLAAEAAEFMCGTSLLLEQYGKWKKQ